MLVYLTTHDTRPNSFTEIKISIAFLLPQATEREILRTMSVMQSDIRDIKNEQERLCLLITQMLENSQRPEGDQQQPVLFPLTSFDDIEELEMNLVTPAKREALVSHLLALSDVLLFCWSQITISGFVTKR